MQNNNHFVCYFNASNVFNNLVLIKFHFCIKICYFASEQKKLKKNDMVVDLERGDNRFNTQILKLIVK